MSAQDKARVDARKRKTDTDALLEKIRFFMNELLSFFDVRFLPGRQ
jgi:hypothetical protein